MRYILTAILSFLLGALAHFAYITATQTRSAQIRKHWDAIQRYQEYMNDPANLESFGDGFVAISDPPNPEPDLAALVAAGELEYADLILPDAPNSSEAKLYWMRFVDKHDDIVYSLGNSSYTAFTPSGDQPLHLTFWYLPTAEPKIQALISHLESMERPLGEPSREPENAN